DGVTDDTAAFQAALADADANGGGIVFVPGGTYRLDGNLTVPTGVELKGVFDVPHGTRDKGSLLNVYAGRNDANGTPFIQIESGAGIRGLTFHYPEQIYDETDTVNYGMVPYPYLIRVLGSDIYVINIAATIPYQLLDLATSRCDRHYVDYIMSTALKTGIHVGNGSVDGQIHNCQFNPSAYTHQGLYYDSIPYGTSGGIHAILWRDSSLNQQAADLRTVAMGNNQWVVSLDQAHQLLRDIFRVALVILDRPVRSYERVRALDQGSKGGRLTDHRVDIRPEEAPKPIDALKIHRVDHAHGRQALEHEQRKRVKLPGYRSRNQPRVGQIHIELRQVGVRAFAHARAGHRQLPRREDLQIDERVQHAAIRFGHARPIDRLGRHQALLGQSAEHKVLVAKHASPPYQRPRRPIA
ncbi:MAG: hypothetical protein IIB55_04760, partial [Planctomycetes bacterium]|nr:hypothetical protein [Planctomycetota bacterium]